MFKKETKQLSFNERVENVKSVFKSTLQQAESLNIEMQDTITSKEQQIAAISEEINSIEGTMKDNSKFISALRKIVE